ncbi:MAG: hypothetical protein B6226_00290 [Candidatus Cloacimonetes bacterium 4572_65]|nr:MAG: hypothetical protein B6226_00290 [Candidatus Cloacimonetes bacterium 4572_65]
MFKKYRNIDPEIFQYLGLIGKLGISMAGSIIGFLLLGRWLDSLFGYIDKLLLAGIGAGLILGILLNYLILKRFYENR